MSKIKTSKTAAKRLKVSKNKKVMRRRAGSSHLLSNKSSKKRRRYRQGTEVTGVRGQRLLRALNKG